MENDHNISEHLVTEEVLLGDTHVQSDSVTSMISTEQVGKAHMVALLQVQVDLAQATAQGWLRARVTC
jgi:hypothetical protein